MRNKLFALFITVLSFNSAQAEEGQTLLEFFGFSSETNTEEVLENYQRAIDQVRHISSVMVQENVSTDYVERVLDWLNNVTSDLQNQNADVTLAQSRLDDLYIKHLNELNQEYGVVIESTDEKEDAPSILGLSKWISSSPDRITRAVTSRSKS